MRERREKDMMKTRWILPGLLLVLGSGQPVSAQLPPLADSPAALAATLRSLLLEQMPPILYEDHRHWGEQKLVTRGIEWKGHNPIPQKQKSHKNNGIWRRVHFTAVNPQQSLLLDIRDMRQDGPNRKTFTTFVALDTRVEVEQQNWRNGVRMLSTCFKARMRVQATLACEVTSRLEKGAGFIPDLVFRMRVLAANVGYDNFVTEHVARVGGDLAEWIGDAGHGLMTRLRPSIERHLMEKADAAIVRAADTKEVRISLANWFSK